MKPTEPSVHPLLFKGLSERLADAVCTLLLSEITNRHIRRYSCRSPRPRPEYALGPRARERWAPLSCRSAKRDARDRVR